MPFIWLIKDIKLLVMAIINRTIIGLRGAPACRTDFPSFKFEDELAGEEDA